MDATKEDGPAKPTPAPAPDVDDFGLPIRRFRPSQEAVAEDGAGAKKGNGPSEPANAAGNAAPVDKDQTDLSKPVSTGAKERRGSGSDSDTNEFTDARSEPSSEPATKTTAALADSDPTPEATTPRPTQGTFPSDQASTPSDPAKRGDDPVAEKTTQLGSEPTENQSDESKAIATVPVSAETKTTTLDKPPNPPMIAHSRDTSIASTANGLGLSEFSHQQISHSEEAPGKDGDDEWQEMPAYARYDMYDDDNRLIAKEHNMEDEAESYGYAGLGGAGKGYTRVTMDDDAQSATSMDENTSYLFKEAASTSLTGADEDDARDAVSQMQATKDLLTEGQRIAYVGVVRLEIAKLLTEAEAVEVTRRTKKQTAVAAEALKMWGQKMMIRLYAHMDISSAEQVMIEQLAEHGVIPQDLTPALLANSRVHNPLADDLSSHRGSTDVKAGKSPELADGEAKAASPPAYAEEKEDEEEVAEPPPPYENLDGDEMPDVKTPSQMPTTDKIDIDLRWTVLCDLFLVLIADSIYDARSRTLLESVAKSLEIEWWDICRFEKRVTDALEMQQAAEKENWNEDEHMETRRKLALRRRYMMMGLATVGGGLVIGLSAGLLAPVIGAGLAAGFTTIGVGGTSSFLAGAGGAAIITSSAAASGSIIGGKAAHRRTGAVKTFEYRPLHNNKRVNLIVTVSGWLTGKVDDVRLPFSTVDPVMGDIYSVLWEPDILRSIGDTINILATEALTQGLQQILGSTILISLMAALQLPIVLTKLSYLIDNPWAVSLDRATSAGQILADSLIERNLGTRPITLVGYSLGSRVIFSCLQELAKKGAYGIVQNVYLFGSPVVVKKEEYLRARTVVSGRFLNGFNKNDWILGYLFRLTNGGIRRVAGLGPIEDCPWIENMDVTEYVTGHMEYRTSMPTLLLKCGWMVESEVFTEIEDPDPENHQERQRELINEIEEARKELDREGKAGKSKFGIFGRKKKGEREEWEVYEDAAKGGPPGEAQKENRNTGVLFDVDAIRAELAKETEDGAEEIQIREIKSTLPPMKLDLSPTTPTSSSQATSLRETKSAEVLPIRPSPSPSTGQASGSRAVSSTVLAPPHDDGMQMAFDTGFEDANRPPPPPKDEASRPDMRTSRTLPNIALADPWGDPDDEDFGKEKEEISMTFA